MFIDRAYPLNIEIIC